MPLLDSALLVVAKEKGFAAAEGVDLLLVRETSWANIRDRLAVGHFNVAHMLAPMPIACNLGLTPLAAPDHRADGARPRRQRGHRVARALWDGDAQARRAAAISIRRRPARALKAVVDDARQRQAGPLRFAVVHPHSGHNYELRYWLAACGIDPERDIEIVIVPPPLMADALGAGRIDGYCVGEPWNTAAVAERRRAHRHRQGCDLAVEPGKGARRCRRHGRETNPEALAALLRALYRAAVWCGDAANHGELASHAVGAGLCGLPGRVDAAGAFSGTIDTDWRRECVRLPDFFVPHRQGRRPSRGRATRCGSTRRWCAGVRCGKHQAECEAIARDTYRPDLYRAALKPLGVALPGANAKVEGALTARDAGRFRRRQPGARPRRFFRRRDLRSRPDRSLTSLRRARPADQG